MKKKKQTAVRQDVKESTLETISRLAGKVLCSDLNQWSLEGGTCLKVQVSQCVLQMVENRRVRGRGHSALILLFAVSESGTLQHSAQ